MPSIWSTLSSSSNKKSPLKGKSKSSNDISGNDDQRKKLTRQRKLRYVTDDDIGLLSSTSKIVLPKSQSLPVSPNSESGPQTPYHHRGHWSKSAVPQPLPLPRLNSQPPRKPNERVTCKSGLSARDLGSLGHAHCANFSFSSSSSNPSHQVLGKTTANNVNGGSHITPNYHSKGIPQGLNAKAARNGLLLEVPARSAPSSCHSSPMLSPQRYRTADLFQDRLSVAYHASLMPSPDHSPLHIRTPPAYGNTNNYNATFFHPQNKSLPESSAARRDNNNNNSNTCVHPLPRPPTVSHPSSSTRQSIDRSDTSSIKGQWRRGRPIGRGTYGSVYMATHCETGATCAVKEVEIVPDDPKCAECIKQLEQEMKFLGELKHPNIVEYYGCEIVEDRFCIYLEYVNPGSLQKYIQENGGVMTESIVRNFTRHILSGLAYLHSTKTIHRDIKGANLLVNASGAVKLADFGLAKHLAGHDISLSLKGTPHWMSPEVLQAVMRKDASPELAYGVDIWSVGCTVIEMLTGKPPWSDCNGVQAMFNILNKAPYIPEALSAEGKDFLQSCFQRRPEDRPSASKLLDHPFLRSSHDQNSVGFAREFSGIKLNDALSRGDWTQRNKGVYIETSQQPSPEHVEDLPCASSPGLNRQKNSISPSSVQNGFFSRPTNGNAFTFSCKGTFIHQVPKAVERKNQGLQEIE